MNNFKKIADINLKCYCNDENKFKIVLEENNNKTTYNILGEDLYKELRNSIEWTRIKKTILDHTKKKERTK